MDAFTQQMLMMILHSQSGHAMGQVPMHPCLSYSTTTTISMAWVTPMPYASHPGDTIFTPHGHTVHPVFQRYVPYSPHHIPHNHRVHGSHEHHPHPPHPHKSTKHHLTASPWDKVARVVHSNTAQRSHGKDGCRERSRRSHAPSPPGRESRHPRSGEPSSARVHSCSKCSSRKKSSHEGDAGAWSTTAQVGGPTAKKVRLAITGEAHGVKGMGLRK